MEKASCCTCFKPKATLTCGICKDSVCKYCAQFLDLESFAYAVEKSPVLEQDTFCGPCYDAQVAPEVQNYQDTLQKAKDVLVFNKEQNKETRFIRRDEDPIMISDCEDRNEVIMRIAFQAAQKGFNGIIDVEIDTAKIRSGSYQTTRYCGSGIPAHVRTEKLIKDRSFNSQPN